MVFGGEVDEAFAFNGGRRCVRVRRLGGIVGWGMELEIMRIGIPVV